MSKNSITRWIIFFGLMIVVLSSTLRAENSIVIKAKKIYPVSNGIIEEGMILIENGKISQVGRSLSIPADAKVFIANVVIPGLIDIHSHLGVYSTPLVEENADGNEATNPITPQVRALDSFNFDDPAIAAGRANGVTTIVSRPGSANIIGGTSVAVKLKNGSPNEMILKEICDLKMAIEGNPIGVYGNRNQMPATLMAVYYLAEKAFIEAQEYMEEWEKYEKKKGDKEASPPKRDLGKEALVLALKREIPVHMHCATASEIMSCIRLARRFNLKLSLGHAYWAHLLIDELEDCKDVHFNIGPPMFFSYYDDPLTFRNNPAILAEHGLKVSLQTDAIGGSQQNLRHLATLCVRYGMREADALKSITLTAAEGVGLDDRIGSIEKGKDADLVFLTGDPFDMMSEVDTVIIDGKIVYENQNLALPATVLPAGKTPAGLNLPENLCQSDQIAIQGGTVYTMAGEPLENGVVLIQDGKIQKVGKNLSIPKDYTVVDATGFVVMPGLVSSRSHVGIGSNWRRQRHIDESSKSVVPALEVKHAVEPQSPTFSFARELGVTTTLVTPGDRNVIGGQGAVLKTRGIVVDKMIARDKAVMMMGLGSSSKREGKMPSTRMGVAALLRETLVKAQEYRAKLDAYEKEKKGDPPKKDLDMEALLPVLRGTMPVMIHAERMDDILTALRITDEFGLKVILDGATDAYKVIDEIQKRGIPVVLENLFRGIGAIEDQGFIQNQPALLSKAGIRVAFRSNLNVGWNTPGAGSPGGDLLEVAAFAVKNGMDEEAALRAVTIDAARIIGMDKHVGSLEAGKDADILILRGHPLGTTSIPEAVLIEGKLVFQRKEGVHMMPARN
ncbi:MAG: amidohydrolase family protein [Candidatus Aminicenantales bacterium]